MGISRALTLLIFAISCLYSNIQKSPDNFVTNQKNSKKENDWRYKSLIIDFFAKIKNAEIYFSQFKKSKKIGEGFIVLEKNKFIKIFSKIGKREFLVEGKKLDELIFKDLYLEEEKKIKPPKVAELLFGGFNNIKKLIEKSSIVLTDNGKIVCAIHYNDFIGSHKILLCFTLNPFRLTFWRVFDRDQSSSYIKVKSIRYNYKNS